MFNLKEFVEVHGFDKSSQLTGLSFQTMNTYLKAPVYGLVNEEIGELARYRLNDPDFKHAVEMSTQERRAEFHRIARTGDRQKVADALGIKKSFLARYIEPKSIYNIKPGRLALLKYRLKIA